MANVAEEHHDNPKEFSGYVNKHTSRAPLGPEFSSVVTDDEVMTREFNN